MSVTIDARRTGLTVDTSIPPLTSNATLGPGGGKFFLGGVLAVEHGGTGAAVLPDGQLLIGDGINPVCSSSALQFSIAQRELVLTGGLEQSSGKFSLQGSGPSVLRTRRGDLCVSANDTLRLNAEADCGDVEIGWAGVANTTTGIMTIKLLGDLRQGGGSFVLHGRRDSAVRSTAALRLSAGGVATLESLADKVQIEAAAGCAITTRAAVDIAAADGCSISAGGVGMVGLDRGGLTLGAPDRPSRFRGAVHDPVVEVRGDTLLDASHHTVVVRAVGGDVHIGLPDAASCPGRTYVVKALGGAGAVTVRPVVAGQTIDDLPRLEIKPSANYSCFVLRSAKSCWIIISAYFGAARFNLAPVGT